MAHGVDRDVLSRLSASPAHIRNMCVLAHVDHGKTTLTDGLLAANGIISSKLAGRVRYMDSTEEEQARGITMKSSAIALLHADEPAREIRQQYKQQQQSSGVVQESSIPTEITENTVKTTTNTAPIPSTVPYLINLIDSPGHVDFSVDVATAARLCDGALVVVDAVEGVCIQTHAVLRTAWNEGVRPALILNKIDRLITELRLSPTEAYAHLCRILEQVNVIMSSLYTADLLAKLGTTTIPKNTAANLSSTLPSSSLNPPTGGAADASAIRAAAAASSSVGTSSNSSTEEQEFTMMDDLSSSSSSSSTNSSTTTTTLLTDAWAIDIDERTEASLFFDPTRGNVVFASAYDGWAFSVDDFARLHCERLGVPRALLRKTLWGEYYYRSKTKRIVTGAAAASAAKGKNLAVSLMLEPLWQAYDCLIVNPNEERVTKIITSLKLEVNKRDLQSKDLKPKLQAVMRAWLPLHTAVLGMVVRTLPSPLEAQRKRLEKLWPTSLSINEEIDSVLSNEQKTNKDDKLLTKLLRADMTLAERLARVRACIAACDTSDEAEVVVFVSKMFAIPKQSLPDQDSAYVPLNSSSSSAMAPMSVKGSSNVLAAAQAALQLPLPSTETIVTTFPNELQKFTASNWYGLVPSLTTEDTTTELPHNNPSVTFKLDLTPITHPSKRTFINSTSNSSSSNTNTTGSSSSTGSTSNDAEFGEDPNSVETFIAFARVFSGVLRADKPVFVLGPKYDPRNPDADNCTNISALSRPYPLFLMMGRDLMPIPAAYAGNVIGIGKLGAHVLKTATLCTTPAAPSLTPMTFQTTPLVRVAIEPASPVDLPAVERGLALLNQADPCVEIAVSDTGELTLAALGELHLQRCVKDLEQRFARVELRVSPPILSFMETVAEISSPVTVPNTTFPVFVPRTSTVGTNNNSNDNNCNVNTNGKEDVDSDDKSEISNSNGSSTNTDFSTIQLANPTGGGPSFPFTWTIPETGVAYYPPSGTVIANTLDKLVTFRIKVAPLPIVITQFLQNNAQYLRNLVNELGRTKTNKRNENNNTTNVGNDTSNISLGNEDNITISTDLRHFIDQFRSLFTQAIEQSTTENSNTTSTNNSSSSTENNSSAAVSLVNNTTNRPWKTDDFDKIIAFGPKRIGPNVLVCRPKHINFIINGNTTSTSSFASSSSSSPPPTNPSSVNLTNEYLGLSPSESILGSIWSTLGSGILSRTSSVPSSVASTPKVTNPSILNLLSTLRSAFPQGFQLSTSSGPLCSEPVWGVGYFIEEITVKLPMTTDTSLVPPSSNNPDSSNSIPSPVTPWLDSFTLPSLSAGYVISVVREASKIAFEATSPRLVEAYYRCELQCSGGRGGGGEALGKCYGVLAKRRGKILAEDLFEGTETFVITALLPVVESFGFADDLRKKTSGAATSPQLLFDHWEPLDIDPFFIPSSKEDKELYGDTLHIGQMKNLARNYVDTVRIRKGLQIERKLVVHADKQRTLSKKK